RNISYVGVNGPRKLQDSRAPVQFTHWTAAYGVNFRRQAFMTMPSVAALPVRILSCDRLLDGVPQFNFKTLNLHCGSGADIDTHPCRLRNGIHRGAAFDHSNVEGRLGGGRDPRLREKVDGASQRHNRVRCAKIAPRVASRTVNNDFEAAAPQRLGDDGVRASAINHNAGANSVLPIRAEEDM